MSILELLSPQLEKQRRHGDPYCPRAMNFGLASFDGLIETTVSSTGAFTFSGSSSTSISAYLQAITGSETAQVVLQDFSAGRSGNTVLNLTQSDLTYTVAPVAATPEPSSFVLLGTGLLGALGVAASVTPKHHAVKS